MRLVVADGQRSEDRPLRRAQGRHGHAAQAHPLRHLLVVLRVRDSWIDQVVRGPDGRPGPGREPVHAAPDRELLALQPVSRLGIGTARHDVRAQDRRLRVPQGEVRAIRVQQPLRGVDRRLQHLVRVTDGGDPGRDALQGALRLHPAGELLGPGLEALRQPEVADGRRGVIGQCAEQGDLRLAEGGDARREGAHGADRLLVDEKGSRDHRAHVGVLHDLVRARQVAESVIVGVVVRDGQLAARHGGAEHAGAHRQDHVPDQASCGGVADPGVVREVEVAARLVEQVDHGAVGLEQARRLVHGAGQELGFGRHCSVSLCSTAQRAAWVREARPSLPRMLLTWVRAVRSVIDSS